MNELFENFFRAIISKHPSKTLSIQILYSNDGKWTVQDTDRVYAACNRDTFLEALTDYFALRVK